jgi:DNA-binding transcriptional LysR family regulator
MDRFAARNAFVRVVEAGSFTKAADTLNMPKASVTRMVQGLEQQLRVRLLHRSTRAVTVTVTGDGATYYERALRLLADLDDLESSTMKSQARPSGRIRVDVSVSVGTVVVVPALGEFYAKYPDIEVDLSVTNRDADLVAENVDCAIRLGQITDQELVARRIGEFRFVACATPEYLEAHGVPRSPADLETGRGQSTIGMMSDRTGRAIPFMFFKGAQKLYLKTPHRLVLNDTNAYREAGLAGLGIVQAPEFTVRRQLADGTLVPVLEHWRTASVGIYIVYAPNRYLSAKVRAFIDWTIDLSRSGSST